MQIAYAGLDTAGNVYVAYPESPLGKQYPNYEGAGVKYKFASPAKTGGNLKWSDARTFANADPNAPGHVLVHMTVGDPGQLMGVYWTGEPQQGREPVWHMTAAETNNGLDANPTVTEARISEVPTDVGTAGKLMGACVDAGPVSGVINGLACDRSPDVYGVALTQDCKTTSCGRRATARTIRATPDDDRARSRAGATRAPSSRPRTAARRCAAPIAGVKVAPARRARTGSRP